MSFAQRISTIFSFITTSKKKHIFHVKKILKKFQQADLYFDINKCDFYITRIKYLDLIIIINEVEMNFKKINIITQ